MIQKYFFRHPLAYPGTRHIWQWAEIGVTQESVEPWRKGRSLVFGIPWKRKAIAVGFWFKKGTEDDFHEAAGTRITTDTPQDMRAW